MVQANQWQVAKAGGVEAVVACMGAFTQDAVVQLSALLCLIPLALENPSLQAHVATLALPAVVAALRAHVDHADVQAKGLVVLGVLGQVRPFASTLRPPAARLSLLFAASRCSFLDVDPGADIAEASCLLCASSFSMSPPVRDGYKFEMGPMVRDLIFGNLLLVLTSRALIVGRGGGA